jgi:hypothetical protein
VGRTIARVDLVRALAPWESPHLGASRLQLVEHEAFLTLMAERGGVPVMPVVAAGLPRATRCS